MVHRNLIANKVEDICKGALIWESCFMNEYVLYNKLPIKLIYNCKFCKNTITKEVSDWIFCFAKDYFETEGPFASFYL